jgi:hypothetical protein
MGEEGGVMNVLVDSIHLAIGDVVRMLGILEGGVEVEIEIGIGNGGRAHISRHREQSVRMIWMRNRGRRRPQSMSHNHIGRRVGKRIGLMT